MEVRLVRRAERDLLAVLTRSRREFGRDAQLRYEALLNTAMRDLGADPERSGVHRAQHADEGVRLYHLRHSRLRTPSVRRVQRPRHVLVFRVEGDRVQILRILHDAMDLPERLQDL